MDVQTQFEAAYADAVKQPDPTKALKDVLRRFPNEWNVLANRLISQGDEQGALKHFQLALDCVANPLCRAILLNDIGRIHANAGFTKESLGFFSKADNLNRNHPGILSNLGLVNRWLGNYAEAEKYLRSALRVNPWESNAALELAFTRLLQGDYANGFEMYEARFRSPVGSLRKLETDKPEWDGTNGKHVLIYGEQGSGDIFLMLRYARLIRAMGVRQSWVVHKAMVPLVQTVPEIDEVIADGSNMPEFDCHFPAASLPRLFKTTLDNIPDGKILPMPDAHDYGDGFHVGIVWRGNKTQVNDRIRSTALKEWLAVLDIHGVTFHSLQVDGADEALLYPQIKTYELPKDWLETARRVAGLDLVVSVDTSMVHLCGSLGVDCWCALHCRPYFVFPTVREDCPWYPTVKLFKQRKEFEWQPVFERIAKELERIKP